LPIGQVLFESRIAFAGTHDLSHGSQEVGEGYRRGFVHAAVSLVEQMRAVVARTADARERHGQLVKADIRTDQGVAHVVAAL
jgi:hypothetical protein